MLNFTPTNEDCLLVIDVQNDFCEGGQLAVPDGDAVVGTINKLVEQFDTIVATQDWHPANHSSFASQHEGKSPFDVISMPYGDQTLWPDHCVQASQGAMFHPELNQSAFQNIIRKGFRREIDSYSAFFENDQKSNTGLGGYLNSRGIKRVVCVGLALDFCVRFSAEDAIKEGFETIVVESACRAIDLDGSADVAKQALLGCGVKLV